MIVKESALIGGNEITFETGRLARQAGGAVVVQQGESQVLVTAVMSPDARPGQAFFPLTCDYVEKTYAAGNIPGGFFKREARLSEREILVCRMIDRPHRPLFPKGFLNETQVIATVISHDRENQTDVLAMTGASAAFMLSEIPFRGPIAGVRVCRLDGQLVVNPTRSQSAEAELDIIVAGSDDAIVMVEGSARMVPESVLIDAMWFGHESMKPLLDLQRRMREAVGKEKVVFEEPKMDEALLARVWEVAGDRLVSFLGEDHKITRYGKLRELKKAVVAELEDELAERSGEVKDALEEHKRRHVRKRILTEGMRIGGRGPKDVREVTCEAGPLPRAHGSAVFTRGETQALVVTTLGTSDDQQKIDALTGEEFQRFLLHYNFPPFSVNEARFLRGPGRREIGHGNLAWRALNPVLPSEEDFPYTIRLVSETLESNGSSSMAAVCGGCLSLMDAGVGISEPVAGIAMGLISDGDQIAILSDILGDEDHLGDMDFKVCGTKDGVTAIQMDSKIGGLSRKVLEQALQQAKEGRLHILAKMAETLAEPRKELSPNAPRITTVKIKTDRIRDIIGPGGKTIRGITQATGCKIDVDDDGTINVFGIDEASTGKAIRMIKSLTAEPEVGKLYLGNVRRTTDFGAFVEILPGTDGLVHISELEERRVERVTDVLHEGDEVLVKVLNIAGDGKIRLSRKAALGHSADEAVKTE